MTVLLLATALTFPATARTTVTIEVGAGDVRIVGSSRTDIAVELEHATAALDGDRIVIRTEDAGGAPRREARARVDMKVPARSVFDLVRIVDGELRLEGLRGRIAADVRQGNIRGSGVSGVVRLETGFGDVTLERAHIAEGGLLRLRAFNGSVRLGLDAQPANARILALTFNGRIESNVPLKRSESFGPKFAEGSFGSGEPVISLDSVTGNITISAAASRRQ